MNYETFSLANSDELVEKLNSLDKKYYILSRELTVDESCDLPITLKVRLHEKKEKNGGILW